MAWPAGEILEVKVGYVVNAQQCYNVLHYLITGVSTGFSPATLTQDFLLLNAGVGNGTFIGEFRKVMGGNVTLNRVSAQGIFPTRYALKELEFAEAGDILTTCTAQNLQSSIVKRGDLADRHNVGGVRIGGLPHDHYSAGDLTVGHLGLMQDLVDDLLMHDLTDGTSACVYTPAILNKTKIVIDGKDHYIVSGATVITSWDVEQPLRTQRTRTKGRGI